VLPKPACDDLAQQLGAGDAPLAGCCVEVITFRLVNPRHQRSGVLAVLGGGVRVSLHDPSIHRWTASVNSAVHLPDLRFYAQDQPSLPVIPVPAVPSLTDAAAPGSVVSVPGSADLSPAVLACTYWTYMRPPASSPPAM